jgi:hypothetical protein
MLTKSQYEKVTQYKERIESCSSNKEAQPYLKKLKFICNNVDDTEGYILSDLCSSLNEYCKQGSDKDHWYQFVLMDYSKLKRFVKDS